MTIKQFPTICPSCNAHLKVQSLTCGQCGTTVNGNFELPVLARLDAKDQEFIIRLIENSGSLKELAKVYKISYPTVRNRLDELIEKVTLIKKDDKCKED